MRVVMLMAGVLATASAASTACTRKRRGFLFTMPLMLGAGILVFAAMIAISQLFVTVGGPLIPDLLADMPTMFRYDGDGNRTPEYAPILLSPPVPSGAGGPDGGGGGSEQPAFHESHPSLAMYGLMVSIALGIFAVLFMLAGLSYFFEEFNVVRPGTAYDIIAKMIILVPVYLALPYLWDTAALVIESSSLYLMDPFGGDPHGTTTELWCAVGSVACTVDGSTVDPVALFDDLGAYNKTGALDPGSWNNALQNPFFGEEFVVNVLLALFKGFSVMFMTAMMFVMSAIRVLLTEVIVVSFPLVSAVGLIPWINTRRISDLFLQNLVGLAMAPVMSAVVLSIGIATIDAQDMPPLRMWFQLLSIGFLAIFFPVMLSPMLGRLSSKVGNMASTALTSMSTTGSLGLRGAAAAGMGGPGMGRAGLDAATGARMAGHGVAVTAVTAAGGDLGPGAVQGGRHTSAEVGTYTSGTTTTAAASMHPPPRATTVDPTAMAFGGGGDGRGRIRTGPVFHTPRLDEADWAAMNAGPDSGVRPTATSGTVDVDAPGDPATGSDLRHHHHHPRHRDAVSGGGGTTDGAGGRNG